MVMFNRLLADVVLGRLDSVSLRYGSRELEAGGVRTTMRPLGEAKPVTRVFPMDLALTGQEEPSFRHWQS